MSWIETTANGCRLRVRVTPRSSRNKVDGVLGDTLKIRLCAPPVEGKANAVLIDFLADALDLPRRALALESGEQSRSKSILIAGQDAASVQSRLLQA